MLSELPSHILQKGLPRPGTARGRHHYPHEPISVAERVIRGWSASKQLDSLQVQIAPLVADLEQSLRQQCSPCHVRAIWRKPSTTCGHAGTAILLRVRRQDLHGKQRCGTPGAERCCRRRNYAFCGSARGADRAAAMYTLIKTSRLKEVDPACLVPRRQRRFPNIRRLNFTAVGVVVESSTAAFRSH